MRIEQAALAMRAEHSQTSEYDYEVVSTLDFRSVYAGVAEEQAKAASATSAASATPTTPVVAAAGQTESVATDRDRQQRLLLLLENIIGHLLDFLSGEAGTGQNDALAALPASSTASVAFGEQRPRVVLEWSQVATERIEEHERSDFTSTGKVATADGRTLEYTLDLSMCRDYSCERTVAKAGMVELRDPLVINFDGHAAELEDQCFSFDLDADGCAENVHALGPGSGYLAIDRNGDGRVNDGGELLGTSSGDGFADLAALDGDGNHWIDEADPAFSTLRVWRRDAAGGSSLSSLRDAGVGALYLGAQETPFALTDGDNRLRGQVRASGIYLSEDGRAGTLQQVDLAV